MKASIFILSILFLCSCSEDAPYSDFEKDLKEETCKCIQLRYLNNPDLFESKYQDCIIKTTSLLKDGLDQYPEDPRLTKDAYRKKIPEMMQSLIVNNSCN